MFPDAATLPVRLLAPPLFALALSTLSTAPFQCAKPPDPSRRVEDDPAEVLYELAGELGRSGEARARAKVLGELVKRYPSSRFAKRAEQELRDEANAPKADAPK